MPVRIDEIVIDDEFAKLIPPLSDEEQKQLLLSIERDGCYRDKLTVWSGFNILLDGHHRLSLYLDHHEDSDISPPEVREIVLPSRDAAKLWMARNQLSRRNLTDFQRVEIALLLAPEIKVKAKENQRAAGVSKVPLNSTEAIDTRAEVAAIAGVSPDTVRKVQAVVENAPPEVIDKARKGDVSVNKAHQSIAGVKPPKGKPEPTAREPDKALPSNLKTVLAGIVRKWPTARLDDFTDQVVSLVGDVVAAEKLRRGQ